MRIITNSKLRKLFSKGPNYREPATLNYRKCRQSIESALTSSVDNLAAKYNLPKESFFAWKKKVLELVDSRIKILKTRRVPSVTKPALEDEEVIASLAELHSKFVVVPIDKAANNVAIICKRFYVQKLLDEVGVPGNASSTYKLSEEDPDNIIHNNALLCEKFGISLEERLRTLPFMYWLPKMHYSPPRARFIIASSNCSTKPLSKITSSIFKHIFNQIRNFHRKSYFYKNYNRFWVIENSSPVIEKLTQINDRKNAKDISTYDFSTLYTKLQHDDLIQKLNEIVDFAFKGGKKKGKNRKYITVTKFSTFWSRKKKGDNSFTKQQVKLMVSHLIKETYFKVGNLLFKQCIGIPMGIDPAPFWANLYLYAYEYEFMKLLMSTDKRKAMRFKYATRFIDDECNLNDGGEFGRSFHLIYPAELELKCEHQGTHATFLDLYIYISDDGIFIYKLFDKRNGFPFFIVRMPDLTGNIPSHVFYGSIMSEFLRIARCTLIYSDFLASAVSLFKRMVNQGGSKEKILSQIRKAIIRHPLPFKKFHKSAKDIMKDISTG